MKDKIIIGSDISKEKLDFFCSETEEHFIVANNVEGLMKLESWYRQHNFNTDMLCIGFEHTGHHGKALVSFCEHKNITFYQIPALEIKRSLGITRGKNDKIDSKRICEYVMEKRHKLIPTSIGNKVLERVSLLKSQRALFVKQRTSLICNQDDLTKVLKLNVDDMMVVYNREMINEYTKKIKNLEEEINRLIKTDNDVSKNYGLLNTIVGIGPVISLDVILATDNFKKFDNWRKFASYCGSAPFEYESGKYVGKRRISSLANKAIKAHLSSGAKSAMRFDPEIKAYYLRKLEEGKTKKCITNAIRCKLIARMFSVVRRKEEYKKNYSHYLEVS